MIIVGSDQNLFDIIKENEGNKMIYIASSSCPACIKTDEIISSCNITTSLLLDNIFKKEKSECPDFCEKFNVSSVPTLIILDVNNIEMSRIEFAPTQDEFLLWLTNTLVD